MRFAKKLNLQALWIWQHFGIEIRIFSMKKSNILAVLLLCVLLFLKNTIFK